MGSDDERYLPEAPRRSFLARILAVAALAGTVVVLFMVVSSSLESPEETSQEPTRSERADPDKEGPETPKEYAVEDGDSLSTIAEKFGISVKRIERLNKDLDPNTLATGQVIKLR